MKAWVALFSLIASSSAIADAQLATGVWKLTRYVDMTEASTSPADIKRNIGKKFVVTEAGIEFRREHCKVEGQQVLATDETAKQFFLSNKSFYEELHVAAPVTVIDTSCNMLIVGSRGELFFEWEGNVFAARKVK